MTKLISLTEGVLGEEVNVKPNKIVAGHEPDKTNIFLQAMFQAATSGIDTAPIVRRILGLDDGEQAEADDGQDEAQAQAMAQAQAEEEAARQQAEAEAEAAAAAEAKRQKKKE